MGEIREIEICSKRKALKVASKKGTKKKKVKKNKGINFGGTKIKKNYLALYKIIAGVYIHIKGNFESQKEKKAMDETNHLGQIRNFESI